MKRFFLALALVTGCYTLFGSVPSGDGVVWHNPLSETGVVQNVICDSLEGYSRLPLSLKSSVREAVWELAENSAGLEVHFYTNSPEIKLKYGLKRGLGFSHMSPTGVSGVDMYRIDGEGASHRCCGGVHVSQLTEWTYHAEESDLYHNKGFQYRLLLPLYNTLEFLEIGTLEGYEFSFIGRRSEKPILVYGTSITQGACASRPGMAWTSILGRRLDWPVVNLGFSGNGRLEKPILDLMASAEASLYVLDCMANLSTSEFKGADVAERLRNAVLALRASSDTPILLLSHPGFGNMVTDPAKRTEADAVNAVLLETFRSLEAEGVGGIYLFNSVESFLPEDGRVDGIHFTDYGMQRMAEAVEPVVRELMNLHVGECSSMRPVTQRREPGVYEWLERHEDMKGRLVEAKPKAVIIGDSITHYWEGDGDYRNGAENWASYMAPAGFFSLGCGWDRLENMLWRVQHGALDGVLLEKIYVWAGTNNVMKGDADDDIIAGLDFLLDAVALRQPSAEIVLVGLLPIRDRESRIAALNRKIRKMSHARGLDFINPGVKLLDRKGRMNPACFKDGLHPNEYGYSLISPFF